jgi:hypothetical protein
VDDDKEISEIPLVAPKEAIKFFRSKGLAKSFAWQDIVTRQHDYFFTIAKMMDRSLLEEMQSIIAQVFEEGVSPNQIAREMRNRLAAAGWWGRQEQVDPLTGETQTVQLGSTRRVRTIIDTNLRTAYSAGRTERQERVKAAFPIGVYKSRKDGRERDEHGAWHDTALPLDHAWWDTHTGPCDWGCRCKRLTMNEGQAKRRGLDWTKNPAYFGTRRVVNRRTGEVSVIEKGIGPGWDYQPGKAPLEGLAPDPLFPYASADDEGIASASSNLDERFLDYFGVNLSVGGVYIDAAGWPIPVSNRWLRGLSSASKKAAMGAAMTITDPYLISALWVQGKDGRQMLVRRYRKYLGGKVMIVDVGGAFWRFALVSVSQARSRVFGETLWTQRL